MILLETNYYIIVSKAGSSDGMIRLWKCSEDFKKLEPLFNIPVVSVKSDLICIQI